MAPKVAKAAGGKEQEKEEDDKVAASSDSPPDPGRVRILCLHGFRTSAKVMSQQVELANWAPLIDDIADLVYLNAPWPASGKSDVEKRFAGPYFEWYQANDDFTEVYGLDEGTSHISDYLSLHGPFDGILGFSQGAILAAALIGLREKGMGPEIPHINFLILVGGGQSRARVLRPAYFDTITCPSLHMIGDKDFMKESGELLVASFKDPVVIQHPSGHVVPRLGVSEGKTFRDFLLRQLQFKLAPTGKDNNGKEDSISYYEDRIALS